MPGNFSRTASAPLGEEQEGRLQIVADSAVAFPGRAAARSAAAQTRGPGATGTDVDPGLRCTAPLRFALHRIRGTPCGRGLQIVADSARSPHGVERNAGFGLESRPRSPSNKRAWRKVVHLVTGNRDEGVAIDHFEDAVFPPHGFRCQQPAQGLVGMDERHAERVGEMLLGEREWHLVLGGQPQLLGAASCVDDAEIRMKPKLNGGREMLTSR
jgi:hypothetical protein